MVQDFVSSPSHISNTDCVIFSVFDNKRSIYYIYRSTRKYSGCFIISSEKEYENV